MLVLVLVNVDVTLGVQKKKKEKKLVWCVGTKDPGMKRLVVMALGKPIITARASYRGAGCAGDLVAIVIAVLVVLMVVFNTGDEKKRKAYFVGMGVFAWIHRNCIGLVVDVGTKLGGSNQWRHQ